MFIIFIASFTTIYAPGFLVSNLLEWLVLLADMMEEDDDPIIAGPCLAAESSDEAPALPAPRRRRRVARIPPDNGHFLGAFICDPGLRDTLRIPSEFTPADAAGGPLVVGWATCSWAILEATEDLHREWGEVCCGLSHGRRSQPWAFLRYSLLQVFMMEEGIDMPSFVDGCEGDLAAAVALFNVMKEAMAHETGTTFEVSLQAYSRLPMRVLRMPQASLDYALSLDQPSLFKMVGLGLRVLPRDLVPDLPPLSVVHAWRKRLQGDTRRASPPRATAVGRTRDDTVLELPNGADALTSPHGRQITGSLKNVTRQTSMDPIHITRAVGFSRFLREQQHFGAALQAAHDYEHPELEDVADDPSRFSLDDAFSRLDMVDCLLHRREFHADYVHDTLVAINAFSDSSPNSGEELQGMVIDISRKGDKRSRVTLPGSTLHYNRFDAVSKAIALLHALWLLAGPFFPQFAYVLGKVISVTTDFGTEGRTISMQDCVQAYCFWMAGLELMRCKDFVVRGQRWLPNAVRIAGWSHTVGNASKAIAESAPNWPRILEHTRSLVVFFRNHTWRQWIKRAIQAQELPPDLDLSVLDHFSCTIAKWRYETVANAFAHLLGLRVVCTYIRLEWFANTQERQTIANAFSAMQDEEYWRFMSTAHREIFDKLEQLRHWGMICECPEHREARRGGAKHVLCWWNS